MTDMYKLPERRAAADDVLAEVRSLKAAMTPLLPAGAIALLTQWIQAPETM